MTKLAIDGGPPVRTGAFPTWPVWGDEEIQGLTEVIKSGQWGRLKGTKAASFEQKFADLHQAKHAVCVNSGTTALRIALAASDIEPGSEVIVPAYTFIASATAVIDAGCIPVFVDIDPGTYNIDAAEAAAAVRDRTAALMPVHFGGRPADMDAVMGLAKENGLKVVEDACQAWGASWKGRPVGAIGDAGCFSFQSSKNITSGEGGIILTNDDVIAKMAQSHHNCGRSEDGQWYEHFFFGGNTRMTEFQAAVLLAQLARFEDLQAKRRENYAYLRANLSGIDGIEPLADDDRITLHACHLFIFRYKKDFFQGKAKDSFLTGLRKEGIPASPGYSIPLYKQPVMLNKAFGPRGKRVDLPVDYSAVYCPETEKACYEEAIWLTQNMLLGTRQDMDDIVNAIRKIQNNADQLP